MASNPKSIDNTIELILPDWSRTYKAAERLFERMSQGNMPEGHMIGHDTPIDGGYYVGAHPREIITVNSQGLSISRLYEEVKKSVPVNKIFDSNDIPLQAYLAVKRKFTKTSGQEVDSFVKQYWKSQGKENTKEDTISLDEFIKAGVGECRHMALSIGVLLERFIREGLLDGEVSVDRNGAYFLAHAWVRYKSPRDYVLILDAMHPFFGSIDEALRTVGMWEYRRPEELITSHATRLLNIKPGQNAKVHYMI